MNQVTFTKCRWCSLPLAWLTDTSRDVPIMAVDEDSLTCQDMADIEDGKPVLFDDGRHRRHVCREDKA